MYYVIVNRASQSLESVECQGCWCLETPDKLPWWGDQQTSLLMSGQQLQPGTFRLAMLHNLSAAA